MDSETKLLVEAAAVRAAETSTRRTLISLGIDPEEPLEAQKDFAALRELRMLTQDREFQQDMLHLRTWRLSMEAVKRKGLITAAGIVIAGGCAALWTGLRQKVGM